jgi:homocysteine S-methyltransferase
MNNGEDLMGNPVGNGGTNFMVACAVNPMAFDIEREIARLERKVAEGAHVAFTQPIFEASTVRQLLSRTEHLSIPIMVGVMHELPGMFIPEAIQQRMRGAAQPLEEGVAITVEFLQSIADVRQRIAGIYIMPPGKRFDMIVEIVRRMEE